MDDLGALIWRFGQRLLVHSEDADSADDHEAAEVEQRNVVHPAAE
jgi:hypothetical protein